MRGLESCKVRRLKSLKVCTPGVHRYVHPGGVH